LEVGDNVAGGWDALLQQAISEWNKNGTVTLKEIAGETNPQDCTPTTGIVEVCNGDYGMSTGWLGLTQLFFNDAGDHIAAVTVKFNDSFFNQSNGPYNTPAARQHTACHELGHSTGLGHVNTASCMNDSQDAVFHNLTPIKQDFQTLAQTYNHSDSTVTVAGSQKTPKQSSGGNKKKHSGRNKKHRNHNHRQQGTKSTNVRRENGDFFSPTSLPAVPSGLTRSETEVVQPLATGGKVVTFITWANG
jgi:hypothetical protein